MPEARRREIVAIARRHDITIVEDFENNLKLIMKDGKLFKNTL